MKYNIGDQVQVKEDLVGENKYGSDTFVTEMEQYRGKTATITGYDGLGKEYILDIDNGDWNWTDEMLD